jgi:hypothetical protein
MADEIQDYYWGFNWGSVYDALKLVAETIQDPGAAPEDDPLTVFGNVEAGKPNNLSLWLGDGDAVLIALGKINSITKGMGGRGTVAHVKGYFLVYTEGQDEESQRRATYLWDRLFAAVSQNKQLLLNCTMKIDTQNPGGFRENDKNMGASKTPNYCAGAVLIVDIAKAKEKITITQV